MAVVYEASDGWHTDIVVEHLGQAASDLQTALDHAKENLSHYVNRRGENAPENATQGAYSLWLMVKVDNTAMDIKMKHSRKS